MYESYLLAYGVVALVCCGMGVAFYVADRATPSSRALALAFNCIGAGLFLNAVLPGLATVPAGVARFFGLFDAVSGCALLQWVLYVRSTRPGADLRTAGGDMLVRGGQLACIAYGVLAAVAPEAHAAHFLNAVSTGTDLASVWFWSFAGPLLFAALAGTASLLLLLNRRPDPVERRRVVAMLLAIPLLATSLALPPSYSLVTLVLGVMVFLVGAVQYRVEQGRRGEFMAQFLSPQVADLVRRRGLEGATAPARMEISVLCVDLRGFTAVTAETDTHTVLAVLRRYYAEIGRIAARYGGTIKDQAGDGILILVGAPVADPRHRQHALDMARAIREVGARLSREWRAQGLELGVGVGVAAGLVTVGLIGEGARREYTAVGTPVNLAARLCERAGDGEVLLAPDMPPDDDGGLSSQLSEALTLKGMPEPVTPLRLN